MAGFPIYETQFWLDVLNNTRSAKGALLQKLIGLDASGVPVGARYTEANTVAWDEIIGNRNIPAPFTRRCGPGVPLNEPTVQTRSLPFPYIDVYKDICCGAVSKRLPGTNGDQSLAARYAAELESSAENLMEAWLTRLNLMLADLLRTGKLVIEGPTIQTQELDFGRKASHTVTLTGAALWSNPAAKPLADLQTWEALVTQDGNTIGANWLFGFNAYGKFRSNEEVKAKFQSCCDKELGNLINNPLIGRDTFNLMGSVENRSIWTCNETYTDPATGDLVPFIDPDGVYVFGDLGLVPVFGAIENKKANFQSMPYFVWQKDCDKTDEVHLESAPLLIPTNPNGSLYAKVL